MTARESSTTMAGDATRSTAPIPTILVENTSLRPAPINTDTSKPPQGETVTDMPSAAGVVAAGTDHPFIKREPIRRVTTRTFQLNDSEIAEISDAFTMFDVNGTGKITSKETRIVMRALGHDLSKQDVSRLLKTVGVMQIDMDNIKFDKFIEAVRLYRAEKIVQGEMSRIYKQIVVIGLQSQPLAQERNANDATLRPRSSTTGAHANGNAAGRLDVTAILRNRARAQAAADAASAQTSNKIREETLRRMSKIIGERLTDEDIREMIEEADRDGDGEVTEDDFMRTMRKTVLQYLFL